MYFDVIILNYISNLRYSLPYILSKYNRRNFYILSEACVIRKCKLDVPTATAGNDIILQGIIAKHSLFKKVLTFLKLFILHNFGSL